MRVSKIIFTFFILLNSSLCIGQLNNSALEQKLPVNPKNANELRFNLHVLGFSKNNEYFNNIADGYTLFGYHLNPRLTYFPSEFVRIEAGALLQKDFGSSGYENIQPTFTIKIQKQNHAFLFGTLEGNLNHGYIEPLYDFERVFTNRIENGIQYLLQSDRVKLDAWLEWSNMLYRAEDDQEDVFGGASIGLKLLEMDDKKGGGDSIRITLPVQFTAQHRGGQIDASELPLLTVANGALGLEIEKEYSKGIVHRIYTKNYLVGYKDFSNEYRYIYQDGYGYYLNAGIDTKYQDVMLSYWEGNRYMANRGGQLYQAVSTTYKNAGYVEEKRRLLILRLMKDIRLMEGLDLTLRLEPVYDFNNPQLEFANSIYLTFDTGFFVAKPKR
ncbi:hypothetical protein [Pontibacter arcticus]|uniref:hypothetical protein n=1 Tax=Pontibacter arcticus TaxID=2080288 RepID=UPI001EF056B2|nr:hypothetical protein [Pontibacter arcticus]